MSISGTLDFASNLAAQATRDAEAVERLVAGLEDLAGMDGAGFDRAAAAAARLAIETEKAGNALALVAAKSAADSQAIAEESEAKLAAIAAKGALASEAAAEMAATRIAILAEKGEQDRVTGAEKAAAQIEAIEAKKQAQLELLAAKGEQASTARSEREAAQIQKAADKSAEKSRAAWAKSNVDGQNAQAESDQKDQQATGDAAQAVADVVAKIVAKIAQVTLDLLEAGAQIAIDAGSFRETSELAFEALTGSAADGAALYEKALDLADKVGLSKEAVENKIAKLMTAGFSSEGALAAIKAVADATQVLGETAGNKLNTTLMKIEAGDKFDARNLSALKSMGIETSAIYDKLGKSLGKSQTEVAALVKAGKITADQGVAAIEAVVAEKFGGIAEKAGQTLPRIFGDIHDEFERLFDKVDTGPLKKLFGGVSSMLTGPEGEKLRAAVNDLFGNLFAMIGGSFDAGQMKGLFNDAAAGIARFGAFVKDITPGVSGFIKGFIQGFDKFLPVISAAASAFLSLMGAAGGMGTFWEKAGEGLGFFIGLLVLIVEIIVEVVAAVVGLAATIAGAIFAIIGVWSDFLSWVKGLFGEVIDAITGAGEGASSAAQDAGGNMMLGFIDGITSKAGAVAAAALAAVKGAISAVTGYLVVKSPSRLTHGIGGYFSEGMEDGIDSGADGVAQAAREMAQDAAAASAAVGMMGPVAGLAGGGAAGAANGNGAKPGNTYHFAAGAVVVHGNTKAEGAAAADGFHARMLQIAEGA